MVTSTEAIVLSSVVVLTVLEISGRFQIKELSQELLGFEDPIEFYAKHGMFCGVYFACFALLSAAYVTVAMAFVETWNVGLFVLLFLYIILLLVLPMIMVDDYRHHIRYYGGRWSSSWTHSRSALIVIGSPLLIFSVGALFGPDSIFILIAGLLTLGAGALIGPFVFLEKLRLEYRRKAINDGTA